MSAADRAAWLAWARGRATEALERGQAALRDGDPGEAARWLGRAHRLAPADATIAVALAGARLREGDPAAAERLLRPVAERFGLREAWTGLVLCALQTGRPEAAAQALASLLSRHVAHAPDAALAALVVARTGAAGWCGLRGDGSLWPMPGGARVELDGVGLDGVGLDGQALGGATPGGRVFGGGVLGGHAMTGGWPGWWRGRSLTVTLAGRPLLGAPLDLAGLGRVEGVVQADAGGLSGWAWHPADPDRDPVLTLHFADGGTRTLLAADASVLVEGAAPLARPRGFAVPAAALPGSGAVRVTDAGGRDLPGSPLDPGLEGRVARGAQPPSAWQPVWADVVGPPARAGVPATGVDVVVPVHGDVATTRRCLRGVLASLASGSRLHVVDDASPDPEMAATLQALAQDPRVRLIRLARNTGFPGAANAGLRAAAGRDVVLLNSDTLVPPGWLERLGAAAHAAPDIGTATPLSNDATICSYPDRDGGNPVPDEAAVRGMARLAAAANADQVVDIPTGHGFCLYIRADCLAATGLLREDLFAQGYGEENDFCLRARHLGWRHVAAVGAYVGHLGGASFGATASALQRRNLAVLNRLHPGYDALIAGHLAADPLAPARRRMDAARWRRGRRAGGVLLVTHEGGGGVERVVAERAAALRAAGLRPVVLRPRAGGCVVSGSAGEAAGEAEAFPNLRFRLPGELAGLARLLRPERLRHAELHHLLGHHRSVLMLCRTLAIPYESWVHDYASFCQRIALVGPARRYCGEPDLRGCEACVADLGSNLDETIGMSELLARSAAELAGAREVVAPSADAASRLHRHFPGVRATVRPWEDDALLGPVRRRAPGARLRVCVLGAIGIEKGYEVLLACVRDASARALPLEFVVAGSTIDDERLTRAGPAFVTGPYRDDEAVTLLAAQDCDLGFLPSIWPETWCYTLTHMLRAGLGVAVFDLGAQAERVRRTGLGWVLPLGLPPDGVNDALLRLWRVAEHNLPSQTPHAGGLGV